MRRREFIAALAGAPVALARSWEQPAFPNWSPQFVDRMLTDSPWAKPLTVPFRYRPQVRRQQFDSGFQIGWPRGGGTTGGGQSDGVRTEFYLTVRWTSALPMRQALAILEFGRDLGNPKAVELLGRQEADYVIDIGGFHTTMYPEGAKKLRDDLAKSVRVSVRGRRSVKPLDVVVPDHGMHLSATLRLPRYEPLPSEDGVIELSGETWGVGIECKFKLRDMLYHGALEL